MAENDKDLNSIGEARDVKAFSPGGKSHFKIFVDVILSLMTCNLCRELPHLTYPEMCNY